MQAKTQKLNSAQQITNPKDAEKLADQAFDLYEKEEKKSAPSVTKMQAHLQQALAYRERELALRKKSGEAKLTIEHRCGPLVIIEEMFDHPPVDGEDQLLRVFSEYLDEAEPHVEEDSSDLLEILSYKVFLYDKLKKDKLLHVAAGQAKTLAENLLEKAPDYGFAKRVLKKVKPYFLAEGGKRKASQMEDSTSDDEDPKPKPQTSKKTKLNPSTQSMVYKPAALAPTKGENKNLQENLKAFKVASIQHKLPAKIRTLFSGNRQTMLAKTALKVRKLCLKKDSDISVEDFFTDKNFLKGKKDRIRQWLKEECLFKGDTYTDVPIKYELLHEFFSSLPWSKEVMDLVAAAKTALTQATRIVNTDKQQGKNAAGKLGKKFKPGMMLVVPKPKNPQRYRSKKSAASSSSSSSSSSTSSPASPVSSDEPEETVSLSCNFSLADYRELTGDKREFKDAAAFRATLEKLLVTGYQDKAESKLPAASSPRGVFSFFGQVSPDSPTFAAMGSPAALTEETLPKLEPPDLVLPPLPTADAEEDDEETEEDDRRPRPSPNNSAGEVED